MNSPRAVVRRSARSPALKSSASVGAGSTSLCSSSVCCGRAANASATRRRTDSLRGACRLPSHSVGRAGSALRESRYARTARPALSSRLRGHRSRPPLRRTVHDVRSVTAVQERDHLVRRPARVVRNLPQNPDDPGHRGPTHPRHLAGRLSGQLGTAPNAVERARATVSRYGRRHQAHACRCPSGLPADHAETGTTTALPHHIGPCPSLPQCSSPRPESGQPVGLQPVRLPGSSGAGPDVALQRVGFCRTRARTEAPSGPGSLLAGWLWPAFDQQVLGRPLAQAQMAGARRPAPVTPK